jgi:hypothetical protein
MQQYTSAATSINKNKVPKLFTVVDKHIGWFRGQINVDIGGGKYDTATQYLWQREVKNYIWDKYNRSWEHNSEIERKVHTGYAHTVTLSNVLNVIKERHVRMGLVLMAWHWVKPGGSIYISVYNSKKEGESKKDCWQNAMTLKDYLKEVQEVCPQAITKHGIIIINSNS